MDFNSALELAKKHGYAEADPSLDVDGWDSAHKICILSRIAFGKYVPFDRVYVEGIREVELLDIILGRELGYTLKLLAISKRTDGSIEIRVHPTFIRSEEALAKVSDVYNAVMVEGDFVGKTMFYGRGAGSHPTASAVVSDIVDVAKKLLFCQKDREEIEWEEEDLEVSTNFYSRYYLRFDVPDKPGVLASVSKVLADYNISIASVLQKEMVCKVAGREDQPIVPLVILTHKAYEESMQKAIQDIRKLPVVIGKPVIIRVEEEAY